MVRPDHGTGAILNAENPTGPDDDTGVVEKPGDETGAAGTGDDTQVGRTELLHPCWGDTTAVIETGDDTAETGKPGPEPAVVAVKTAPLRRRKQSPRGRGAKSAAEPAAGAPDAETAGETAEEIAEGAAPAKPQLAYRERRVVRKSPRSEKQRGRILAVAGALIVTVVVAAGAVGAVFFTMQTNRLTAAQTQRAEYLTFAEEVATDLFTVTADNADNLVALYENRASGRAQQMLRESIPMVLSIARESDDVVEVQIVSAAVTESAPSDGQVILVISHYQKSSDPDIAPEFNTFSIRTEITRINGELKLTGIDWVAT